MSGAANDPAPPRRRARASVTVDDVTRGASPEMLAKPACELLADVPWRGVTPDPDILDAATFLSWL